MQSDLQSRKKGNKDNLIFFAFHMEYCWEDPGFRRLMKIWCWRDRSPSPILRYIRYRVGKFSKISKFEISRENKHILKFLRFNGRAPIFEICSFLRVHIHFFGFSMRALKNPLLWDNFTAIIFEFLAFKFQGMHIRIFEKFWHDLENPLTENCKL